MLLFIGLGLSGQPSERRENREEREALHDALEALFDPRTIDDDNVSRIDLWILGLAVADRRQVERRRLALPAGRAEHGHAPRIGVLARASGQRDRLHQAGWPGDREGPGLLDRAIDRHRAAGRGLDADADVRILEIF